MGQTLFDKVWNRHVLYGKLGEPQLLYIDLHLIHEVTSPQAFEGLRLQNRKLRRPDLTFATLDHNVPTIDIFNIKDEIANKQIATLQKNAIDFGVHIFDMGSDEQGIVHMEHLVLLHLELEQVKLNMFSQLKRYGKQNPKT